MANALVNRRQPQPHRQANYHVGDVVTFLHLYTQNSSSNPRDFDKNVELHSKRRPGIVTAVYPMRIVVLPMYSYEGHGLVNKPEDFKLTIMSVLIRADQGESQTKESLYVSHRIPDKLSFVNLAQPVTVDSHAGIQETNDALTAESKELLQKRIGQLHESQSEPNPLKWYKATVEHDIAQKEDGWNEVQHKRKR